MIEVIIRHVGTETELGAIRIENVMDGTTPDVANYKVTFAVERIASVGIHDRVMLNFPRTKYNVLGLLRQALNTLDPEELELDAGVDVDGGIKRKGRLPWRR